jgi:uncharacterized protein (TIGR02452 family)
MYPEDVIRIEMKMKMLIWLAHVHKHDCLILGAWGCGAYACPPGHVAKIMVDMVRRYSRIKYVVFACPGALRGVFAKALTS